MGKSKGPRWHCPQTGKAFRSASEGRRCGCGGRHTLTLSTDKVRVGGAPVERVLGVLNKAARAELA